MRPKTVGWLKDIHDAARFIEEDTADATLDTFLQDRRIRQLVERNLEIIGEAVRRLRDYDPKTAERITAYRQIIALRNVVAHGYDVIEHSEIWAIVQTNLPGLKAEVEQLLREIEG